MPTRLYLGTRVFVREEDVDRFNKGTDTKDPSLGKYLIPLHTFDRSKSAVYAKAFVLTVTTPRWEYQTTSFRAALHKLFQGCEDDWNATCVAISACFRKKSELNPPCPVAHRCKWSIWAAFIHSILDPAHEVESFNIQFTKATDFTEKMMTVSAFRVEGACPFSHEVWHFSELIPDFEALKRDIVIQFNRYLCCCANGVSYIEYCINSELLENVTHAEGDCVAKIGNRIRSILMYFVAANAGCFSDSNLRLSTSKHSFKGSINGDLHMRDEMYNTTFKIGGVAMKYSEVFDFSGAFRALF